MDVAGIRKFEGAKRLAKEAYRCWMFGLLFSTMSGVYSLYGLKQQQSRIDKKDGEGVVTLKRIEKYTSSPVQTHKNHMLTNYLRERAAINLQLVSDLCDLTIPTSAIGLIGFDDGFVGLAGTVSSLLGVYSQWKKTG